MKINMEGAPSIVCEDEVEVGNVYKTQKKLYVIAQVFLKERSSMGNSAVAFSIDAAGNIDNVVSYTTYYFSRQKLVGHASNMPEILEVDWF